MDSSSTDSRGHHDQLMRLASYASVAVALCLIGLKLWAYLATNSISLLSSLSDSLLDVIASTITLFAIRVALTPADREHRFGHGKSEGVAALAQSLIVFASAIYVAAEAIGRLVDPTPITHPELGLGVMLVSLGLTLILVLFQRHVATKTRSVAIAADELHYRADLATNMAVIAAIFLTNRTGWYWLDPVVGLVVVAFILSSVKAIMARAFDELLDRELPDEDRRHIQELAQRHPEVKGFHDLRTRSAGRAKFIQLHLELEPQLTLSQAHQISDAVEHDLQQAFPDAEVLIHTDPYGLAEDHTHF
jgi:ferrous-iron efflux pump FieF